MSRDNVRQLQRALLAQGYELPRWGADGYPGAETLAAVDRWAWAHGHSASEDATPLDRVPPELAAAIIAAARAYPVELPHPLVDARDPGLFPGLASHPRWRRDGTIPWPRVTTITLHQTDCRGSTNPGWVRWSKSDLPSHYLAACDGSAAWLNDLNALIWHGQGLSRLGPGVDVEGRFAALASVPDERRTDHLSDDQVAAALACIRHACAEVASHGGQIRYLAAHRQSWVASRRGDPGEEIWRRVALPAMAELGLLSARTLPAGAPIPEAWDPRAVGVRY